MLISKELNPNNSPIRAEIHWIVFLGPLSCAAIFTIALFGQIITAMSGVVGGLGLSFITAIIAIVPLVVKYFQVKGRNYTLSNPYLIVEESFFGRIRKEIEVSKINNIEIYQTFLDKLVNSGDLIVYSSNDQAIRLKNIKNPMFFKKQIQLLK